MLARSVSGTRCPKEGKPREYITDQIPEEVPDSAYYLRLVADGSLITADAEAAETKSPADAGGKKKGGKQ